MSMRFAILALGIIVMPITACAETVRLYAAGSLKAVLIDLTAAFEAVTPGVNVETTLGASGLLRERIETGKAAHRTFFDCSGVDALDGATRHKTRKEPTSSHTR